MVYATKYYVFNNCNCEKRQLNTKIIVVFDINA
jgi:hypothetical protein